MGQYHRDTAAFVVAGVKGSVFSFVADGVGRPASAMGRLYLVCTTHNGTAR